MRSLRLFSAVAFGLLLSLPALAQVSSSAAPGTEAVDQSNPAARPRVAQIEAGGASVTLETSEPLFEVAAALNACEYDADLDRSAPVRAAVRKDMNAALAASESARSSRDALCEYIARHRLADTAADVGQYVSLALYLSPPPELAPNVDESELPPQAAQVVNVLPLLRTFSQEVNLHYIWLQHRAAYEALVAQVHDPLARTVLDTNIFLHQPVSSYDGRRFLILLEPMLSPALTNARIYGSDYIIVTSPGNTPADSTGAPIRLDEIRHIYLHYVVDPMVYSRGAAMERIQPLLRGVADAPLDFVYKSDVVALITECLIKAIEARMYTMPGVPEPARPKSTHTRAEDELYTAQKAAYDRQTDLQRDKLVSVDESQGWVLTGYFYQALTAMSHNGDGLRDEIAPMIYGMDVDRERHHAEQVVFTQGSSSVDPLRPSRQPHKIEGLELAELDLLKGKMNEAADLAEKANADPKADHGRATYILARIDLMQGDPDKAIQGFTAALKQSQDPRTIAWSHIYLGRLYDIEATPERDKAIAEYKAALASRDSRPDTKAAAEAGLKQPFALPRRAQQPSADDDKDFDPTGKAEKEAYKPGAPSK